MLYNFQKDAALAIISKLEKYNGCILADSVGLGKTHLLHALGNKIIENLDEFLNYYLHILLHHLTNHL